MANRFFSPFLQYFTSTTRDYLAGGKLAFYITGSTTPANTYSNSTLTTANANPVILDSAGRHGPIFLDPATTYKAVLSDADDNVIMTADPVVDPAANVTAAFQIFAGNPNGSVAGNAGAVGGSGASVVWDITNQIIWVCTTSGTAATAVWSQPSALGGQLLQSGVITPTQLSADTDNWNPAGLDTASVIRVSTNAAHDLTGIVAQPDGALYTIHNVGSNDLTLKRQNAGSSAANRFEISQDIRLGPDMSVTIRYDAISSRWRTTTPAENNFPVGFMFALTLSNNAGDATNDIDIAAGGARDGTGADNLALASALTKKLDVAWAVGNNQGGRDTGAIANDTWHVWLIKRSDTGVVDVLFSLSASSPTMPANYDLKRRIGAIVRSGGTILAFSQRGDEFLWDTAKIDIDAVNPGTAAVTRTLTLPTGILATALISAGIQDSADNTAAWISSLSVSDQAADDPTTSLTLPINVGGSPLGVAAAARIWAFTNLRVRTNSSAQIRSRVSASNANTRLGIITYGWLDDRGRDG